jgi:hypothetical protein
MESVAMPRPTVVNAKRQPIPPLNLEELKFWLRDSEEHAVFIKAGLPCDNVDLINEANVFTQEFAGLRAQADKVQNERRFADLVADARTVAGDFYRYTRRILLLVLTCQIGGCNFALFLDHVSRETEYFIQMLDKLASGQEPLYQVASARETVFWVRLFADHAGFIVHRLDPSERSFIDSASTFVEEFDELYLQGRDFVSMLRGIAVEVPSFRRYLKDVRVSTMRLRDFTRAAETLIVECRLVGLIPALLADHMRREEDHFLLILTLLEKGTYVPYDEDGEMEYLDTDSLAAEAVAAEEEDEEDYAEYMPPMMPGAAAHIGHKCDDEDDDDDDDNEREPAIESPLPPPPPPPIATSPPVGPPKPAKPKWTGRLPRPLGKISE